MDYDHTCPVVKSVLLLDADGRRVAVKYYSPEWSTVTAQANYEKAVYAKTCRTNARSEAEIIMFDDVVVVYKFIGDLMFYVTGSSNENELILFSVLQAFHETVSLLLRGIVEKKTVLENLDLALLTIDEIIDGGLILETEPAVVASRVTMRGAEQEGSLTDQVGVQSFTQALQSAKEQIARSLLK